MRVHHDEPVLAQYLEVPIAKKNALRAGTLKVFFIRMVNPALHKRVYNLRPMEFYW